MARIKSERKCYKLIYPKSMGELESSRIYQPHLYNLASTNDNVKSALTLFLQR